MKIKTTENHVFDKAGNLDVSATKEAIQKSFEEYQTAAKVKFAADFAALDDKLSSEAAQIASDNEEFGQAALEVVLLYPTVKFSSGQLVGEVLKSLGVGHAAYSTMSARVARVLKTSPDWIKARGRSENGGVYHRDHPPTVEG